MMIFLRNISYLLITTLLFCYNDWQSQQKKMIQQLIRYGIQNKNVLKVMSEIPRHHFVPEPYKKYAYEDTPLPIGYNQTISQPYIVALMTELLQIHPEDQILEIGTGSGYQAAILAKLAHKVYTIEIIPEFCIQARQTLKQLQIQNVTVICGDGFLGYPERAPYDKIILTAAPKELPKSLIEQLKENGTIVAPIENQDGYQYLYTFTKKKGKLIANRILPVRFVPMISH